MILDKALMGFLEMNFPREIKRKRKDRIEEIAREELRGMVPDGAISTCNIL